LIGSIELTRSDYHLEIMVIYSARFDLDYAERISPIVKTITQNNIMDEIAN
jgi:hypothetical protein